jgi:putative transposase
MAREETGASLTALSEQRRRQVMERFAVLRPHLEEGVPLTHAAGETGIPIRTVERWLARYRSGGLAALARVTRSDAGKHRSPADLVTLVEGMALKRPLPSAAAIHRRIGAVAKAEGWHVPSYSTVKTGRPRSGIALSWSTAIVPKHPTRSGKRTTPCSTFSSSTPAESPLVPG